MKFIMAIGEEPLDLRRADTARLLIGGVEPEVVREDHPPGLSRRGVGTSENTQHISTNIAANL